MRCVGFRVKADKQIDNSAPCNSHKKTSALKLGTWNIRTMTPGFSDYGSHDDLQEIDDVRKTAVIDMELSRLQMDIVALQETRLPDSGSVKKKTSHSSGREVKDKFYDDLAATIKKVPEREALFILGDFNARVGADHNSWPTCLGCFGNWEDERKWPTLPRVLLLSWSLCQQHVL